MKNLWLIPLKITVLLCMAAFTHGATKSDVPRLLLNPTSEEGRSILLDSAYDKLLIQESVQVLEAIRSGRTLSSIGLYAGNLIIEHCDIDWDDYSCIYGMTFNSYWGYNPQAAALVCTKFLLSLPAEISDDQAFVLMKNTGWLIPDELLRQREALKLQHRGVRMSPFHPWRPE
jgi:hypothetical protein